MLARLHRSVRFSRHVNQFKRSHFTKRVLLSDAKHVNGSVECTWSDGSVSNFDVLWLRDHDPSTLHPDSGQKTVELRDIPRSPPKNVMVNDSGRTLQLDSNRFCIDWLLQQGNEPVAGTRAYPWRPSSFEDGIHPICTWEELLKDDKSQLACLRSLRRNGFMLVSDCPPTTEATHQMALRISRIQETFYGGPIWDVVPRKPGDIMDTAYDNCELPLHTDCTYLKHQPGLQMFNCVEQVSNGGVSGLAGCTKLADGFMVADILMRSYPETFDFFCNVLLPFHHYGSNPDHYMFHTARVFEIVHGQVVSFRYNELDRAPLAPPMTQSDIQLYYKHQAILAEALDSVHMPLRLNVGETLIVDNHRLAHGRYGFKGRRSMIGCYMTPDDWVSNLRVLENKYSQHT